MTEPLRILSSGTTSLLAKTVKVACVLQGYEFLQIPSSGLNVGHDIPVNGPDVIVLCEGETDVRLYQAIRKQPAIAFVPIVASASLSGKLDADAFVPESAGEAEVGEALRRTITQRETLHFLLRRFDPHADVLAKTERCEWVRSNIGILGLVHISEKSTGELLRDQIRQALRDAHAILDALPENRLSLEDLWNLLLFISVPWTKAEIEANVDVANVLSQVSQDTSASRKVVLPQDSSLRRHIGPMDARGTPWMPSSADPLREAIWEVARDTEERGALEALFKPRISEADLDSLIRALSRGAE